MGQQISFTSKAENLNQVEVLINTVCKKYEVNEDYYGNILIALTEAVNNAIHHGNKSNPNKTVTLGFYAEDSILKFTVEDEGPGFDYQNLPDPTDPKNIEKLYNERYNLYIKYCDKRVEKRGFKRQDTLKKIEVNMKNIIKI